MARHSSAEYRQWLEEQTGFSCGITCYDEGEYERFGAWLQNTELVQFPDVKDLAELVHWIPSQLSLSDPLIEQRFQILQILQHNQRALEHVLKRLPAFREKLEELFDVPNETLSPLTISRRVRGQIENILWNATPLFLAQLEQEINKV